MEKTPDQIVVKRLNTKEEMLQAYKILKQRYQEVTKEDYAAQLSEMIENSGFKMIAAFLDDEIVGISGYWIQRMFYCGRYIHMSSFIVDEEKRGSGIGKKLINEIEAIGKEHGCEKVVLDSFTENKKSHALYYRENFSIRAFHFMKDL